MSTNFTFLNALNHNIKVLQTTLNVKFKIIFKIVRNVYLNVSTLQKAIKHWSIIVQSRALSEEQAAYSSTLTPIHYIFVIKHLSLCKKSGWRLSMNNNGKSNLKDILCMLKTIRVHTSLFKSVRTFCTMEKN